MRGFIVMLMVCLALAGCTSEDPAPASLDQTVEEDPAETTASEAVDDEASEEVAEDADQAESNASEEVENLAPEAALDLSAAEVEPGSEVEIQLDATDEEGDFLEWALTIAGEEAAGGTEEDLPYLHVATFDEEGTFEVVFTVSDGEQEVVENATVVVAAPPQPELETIVIEGTVTGVPEAGMGNTETFEVVAPASKMTLTFQQGPTAVDLDFYLYDPSGAGAGTSAGFEALGSGSEVPMEVSGAVPGEWSIDVVGYLAVEGAYTITITFE